MLGQDLLALVGNGGVVARLVQWAERAPELPAGRLVRLSRRSTDGDDRRVGLLGERGSRDAARDEHERAGRRVDRVSVHLEPGTPGLHEVQLLRGVVLPGLVVLVDHAVARLVGRERVDAERLDAELETHAAPWY